MGRFHLSWDSKQSQHGTLTSIDVLLNSLLVECVALAAIARFSHRVESLEQKYIEDHGADIVQIEWTNPFDIAAMIRSVTQVPLDWVLNRTIFYKAEFARRDLENEKLRQSVVQMKMDNINKLIDLRAKALAIGMDPEHAARVIADVANDMKVELRPASDQEKTILA